MPTSSCEVQTDARLQLLAFHLLVPRASALLCVIPWASEQVHPAAQYLEVRSRLEGDQWRALAEWAAEKGLEKGQRIRLDATAVESDIHHPTDSLCSCAR